MNQTLKIKAAARINEFISLFANRRMWVILLMGFSSGLPIALCGSTMQAWYTVSGINIVTIGILSLVGQLSGLFV